MIHSKTSTDQNLIEKKYNHQDWKQSQVMGEGSSMWCDGKPPSVTHTGVSFIDNAMQIDPATFLLVGAGPGTGKTALALSIARHNAMVGKKVMAVFLESYTGEMQDRRKHQLVLSEYYNDPKRKAGADNRFQVWRNGTMSDYFSKYTEAVQEKLKAEPSFALITKKGRFDINALETLIAKALSHRVELLVLDHIHYFDYDTEQETKALTEIVRVLEDLVNSERIAVCLFAQFRKNLGGFKQKKFKTMDDFHGTARLSRSATDILILTKGDYDDGTKEYTTYMHFEKSRAAQVAGYASAMRYSLKTQNYMRNYALGKIKADKFENIRPVPWAKDAV